MHAMRSELRDVVIPLVGFNPSGGIRMVIHAANELAVRGVDVAFFVPRRAAEPPVALHPGVALIERGGGTGPGGRAAFVLGLPRARVYVATGYQTPVLISLGMLAHAHGAELFHLVQADERTTHIRYGSQPAAIKPLLAAIAAAGLAIPATRVAVSASVADAVGHARIRRVINPGIAAGYIERAAGERARAARAPITVGLLAAAGRVKAAGVALDAFARVREPVRFVAFAPDDAFALPATVERFPRTDDESIARFYDACDVFVFPSLAEGFGLPPLEAMACGAAVVLADCGGVREYAAPGKNCLAVPPGDVAGLASAIDRLARDAALRESLARAGRATAARFPAERFAAQCADEIARLLA